MGPERCGNSGLHPPFGVSNGTFRPCVALERWFAGWSTQPPLQVLKVAEYCGLCVPHAHGYVQVVQRGVVVSAEVAGPVEVRQAQLVVLR